VSIYICYTSFEDQLPHDRFTALLAAVPADISRKVRAYRRWQDAHAALLGKHLLIKAMSHFNQPAPLDALQYSATGRPYLDGALDFNISHAGNLVVCAVSTDDRIGIDLEELKPIEFSDFNGLFTVKEWEDIHAAADPLAQFYHYWTIKEAVVKADGVGISELNTLTVINHDTAQLLDTTWYLKKIPLAAEYVCHLATAAAAPDITIEEVSL